MLKNKKVIVIIAVVLFIIILGLGAYGFYMSRNDKPEDLENSSSESSSISESSSVVSDNKTITVLKGISVYTYNEMIKKYNSYMNDKSYNTEMPKKNPDNEEKTSIYVESGRVYYGDGSLVSEIADSVVSYEEISDEGIIITVFVTNKNELYYSVYDVDAEIVNFKKLITTEKVKGIKKIYNFGIVDYSTPIENIYVVMADNTIKKLEYNWSGEVDFELKKSDNIIFNLDEILIYKDGTLGLYEFNGDESKIIKDIKYPNIKVDKILYGFIDTDGSKNTYYIIATDGYLYKPVWNYTDPNESYYKMSLERVSENKIKEAEISLQSEYNEYADRTDYSLKKDLVIFFE